MPLTRSRSGSGLQPNKNTEFLGQKGFWLFYAILVLAFRALVGGFLTSFKIDDRFSWTVINLLHALITLRIIHWSKGTPYTTTQEENGEFDELTFWEQIDNGRQFTTKRKVLTLIPFILFLLAVQSCSWEVKPLFFNLILLAVSIIPKTDWMHRVRIGGINKD